MTPRLFVEPNRPSGHGVTICTSLCNGHSSIARSGALIGQGDLALHWPAPEGPPSGPKGRRRPMPRIHRGARKGHCLDGGTVLGSTHPTIAKSGASELEAGRFVVNPASFLEPIDFQRLIAANRASWMPVKHYTRSGPPIPAQSSCDRCFWALTTMPVRMSTLRRALCACRKTVKSKQAGRCVRWPLRHEAAVSGRDPHLHTAPR